MTSNSIMHLMTPKLTFIRLFMFIPRLGLSVFVIKLGLFSLISTFLLILL